MKIFTFAITALTLCACLQSQYREGKSNNEVMLQGFHWESYKTSPWWNVIADKTSDIGSSGFDMVWFPPSSGSAAKQGYLPHRLYHQNSAYGSAEQLRTAIARLHSAGVKSIADIVINHRVGTKDWADFTEPQWGSDAVCSDDEWPQAKGNKDSGSGYHAARDVDHTQVYVQNSLIEWMKWMKNDMGYDGWRYDYTKGYGGYYNKVYNQGTMPHFAVGELWDNLDINNPNAHRQQLCDWIDAAGATASAFDFTTKGILQHAVGRNEYWRLKDSQGKPVGLIGWWPAKAVTFIDNHDTGPSPGGGQNHWPFPADRIMEGYAYILTHPGVPCVYWVHFYDWNLGKEIRELIRIRKSNGINSTSKVEIKVADSSKYAAIIDGKIAMKIGSGDWNPGPGWTFHLAGKNYAIWHKN